MAEQSGVVWRYAGDPGVGMDDEANVMTLLDGRWIESKAHLLAWLDEEQRMRHLQRSLKVFS